MKIRNDFVTNSSSSSFILSINLISDEGEAWTSIAVSPETCFSEDGDMTAECISLYPHSSEKGVYFNGEDGNKYYLSDCKNVEELCNRLFEAAEISGWYGNDNEPTYEDCCEMRFFIGSGLKSYSKEKLEDEFGAVVVSELGDDVDYILVPDDTKDSSEIKKALELNIGVLSESEFMRRFDSEKWEEKMDDMYDGDEMYEDVSVKSKCPKTLKSWIKSCKKLGINMENLRKIVIDNRKTGSGDSAMWVESDVFSDYIERYRNSDYEEEKEGILNELMLYIISKPELPVNDNEYELDDVMRCAWDGDEESLRAAMKEMLEGKMRRSYWMADHSDCYVIDVKSGKIDNDDLVRFS